MNIIVTGVSMLDHLIEQLNELIKKQTKYDEYNSIFNGRNSFSKKKIMLILNLKNKKFLLNLKIMKSQKQRNSRMALVRKKKSLKNITTPKGILLKMNRSIQVEGALSYGLKKMMRYQNIILMNGQ